MENLSAFVWGVVVTLGGVAVVVLLWHLWQQHQQPAQQQPQIPQYVHGINASVLGTLQVIQQILQAVQNPTRVRVSSWRVAAFNDHADLSPPSIDVQSGQSGN